MVIVTRVVTDVDCNGVVSGVRGVAARGRGLRG